MNIGRFAAAVIGVWIVRVALNATFYTQIVGRQFELMSSAHPGMFRTVIPAYIVTDLIFALVFTFLFVKVGAALGGPVVGGGVKAGITLGVIGNDPANPKNRVLIDPAECSDCAACEPACSWEAIYQDAEVIGKVFEFSSDFDNKADRDDPGQQPESEAPGKGKGERILVVDDHPGWLKVARTMLSAGGYDVQTCQYPRDAVLLFKQNPGQIDLVITDLNMPSLNGIELAAELVRINVALPVVLTSLEMVELTSEKLQALGIRDFLPKPWERGQVLSIIRQALSGKPSKETQ